MLKVVAVFEVKPEFAGKVKEILLPLIEGSRKDAGNISYDCYEMAGTVGKFIFQESWEDQSALDAHMKEPHFIAFGSAVEPMLAGPMDIFVLGNPVA